MRENIPRGWPRWRVTITVPPALDFHTRLTLSPALATTPALADAAEVPGPDGIRHALVARVRQQIADGTYDTEEKWALAEEALLRRIERCA